MNIQGNIGWINVCRTDPSQSYVIGGSEEANEEIRGRTTEDKKYLYRYACRNGSAEIYKWIQCKR